MKEIRVFSPATVANVNCGFDLLGFALEGIGDEILLRKVPQQGIKIVRIEGAELPLEASKNVAGVAGMALLEHIKADYGFEIEIKKGIPLGSGIGGSAASAAAVVFGINQFLETPFSLQELAYFGMKGEAVASGNEHADNVAPAIFGGFTLIPSYNPFTIVSIPVPANLYVTIIHPHIEIKTKEARQLLPKNITLQDSITQSGNLAGLVAALYTSDYKLLQNSLHDVLVEPHRKALLPLFDTAKEIALTNSALGFGISGSGPSMFSLCNGKASAEKVEKALSTLYKEQHITIDSHISKVSTVGSKIIP
ncbi:homoserine kinase [Ulvibacter litoralis]|uniref:Homoserine kinase n=1 Tax=Ulvibacter litoralis TaxID=227084 RepID=A0A1G7FRZ8_9FLAO|nr:homoserine kinase [Ulvibacter litoralis]GHC63715.1 homoserine kinase [Ulvibacter litoralis]SDE78681.1 homoserine kinase [Ulvibacter litoralis]